MTTTPETKAEGRKEAQASAAATASRPPAKEALDADKLAQFIRVIDGDNTMGAGQLADLICERFAKEAEAAGDAPVVSKSQAKRIAIQSSATSSDTADAPVAPKPVAWMLRDTETGEIYWDETECIWSDASSANDCADGLNENVVGGDAEGPWEAIPLYITPPAPAKAADAPVARDREADRARFIDAGFNRWLDDGISDAGHTVYDAIPDIACAWQGWVAREYYGTTPPAPASGAGLWRCSYCGDAYNNDADPRWRWNGEVWQHHHDGSGHVDARFFGTPTSGAVAPVVAVSDEDVQLAAYAYACVACDTDLNGNVRRIEPAAMRAALESFANRRAAQGERHE